MVETYLLHRARRDMVTSERRGQSLAKEVVDIGGLGVRHCAGRGDELLGLIDDGVCRRRGLPARIAACRAHEQQVFELATRPVTEAREGVSHERSQFVERERGERFVQVLAAAGADRASTVAMEAAHRWYPSRPRREERFGVAVALGRAPRYVHEVLAKKDYTVRLEGVDAFDLPMSVLRDLCDLFLEGAQRSARLVAEGRSVARGTVPSWASAAAELRLSRFDRGSLDLELRAPQLGEVAPDVFAQRQLFPAGTDPDATAFDLFLDAADDAIAGNRDSERLDAGVLEVLARAGGLFARGGTRLSVTRSGKRVTVVDPAAASVMKRLADETPPARVFRVRGVLDTLTVSTRAVVLRLDDGRLLRGFAGGVALEPLKEMLGTAVVLEGSVAFRPSGEALRIEVESALPAKSGDVIWAQLPTVNSGASRPRVASAPTGLDAFFGKWPGDETDDQLASALKDLS